MLAIYYVHDIIEHIIESCYDRIDCHCVVRCTYEIRSVLKNAVI